MKSMFGIMFSISLAISNTGCSTRVLSNASNMEVRVSLTPAEAATPVLNNSKPEANEESVCNALISKKKKRLTDYESALQDKDGKEVKILTTVFASEKGTLLNQTTLFPMANDEPKGDKYYVLDQIEEMTFKGVRFGYIISARRPFSENENRMGPIKFLFRCVDKSGNGSFEKLGSDEQLIIPDWLKTK